MRPIIKRGIIQHRQDAVAYFSDPSSFNLSKSLTDSLSEMKDLPNIANRIVSYQASVNDWKSFFKVQIHTYLQCSGIIIEDWYAKTTVIGMCICH